MSSAPPRTPILFVGHGAPTLATDVARGAPLRAFGAALAKPRAVLWLSAHFEAAPLTLSSTERLPLVYDFRGFPKALYEIAYPAPGAPFVAERVQGLLEGEGVTVDARRGLDHGAWVPALHLWPEADVPMIQLSLPTITDTTALYALGQRLSPLRDEGVLVVGSGNVTHNLREVDFSEKTPPPSWAREFDAFVAEALARGDTDALLAFADKGPGAERAHPRAEHFVPLLIALGAVGPSFEVTTFVEGFEYGSLSQRSVALD